MKFYIMPFEFKRIPKILTRIYRILPGLLSPCLCGGLMLLTLSAQVRASDEYVLGPDSRPHEGVPKGEVTKYVFSGSKVFPSTTRNYWVYVPKEYSAAQPACLLVVQDGVIYNTPKVLDNLINGHEMPVTIAVFVAPGTVDSVRTNVLNRLNRSYEYDGLGGNYVRFLIDELLPEVTKKYNISTNGNDHAIAGTSSGAIASFTAAWERPDYFTRVFSAIGSYGSLRGGDVYGALIRKTESKPIRFFFQDGSADAKGEFGDWPRLNQGMVAALQFAGYEVTNVWGDGAHTMKHADSIFPDVMRFLWKDYPAPVAAGVGSKQPLTALLLAGELWEPISGGHKPGSGLTADSSGQVYFDSPSEKAIYKINLDGGVSLFAKCDSKLEGLSCGADGTLYAGDPARRRIVAFDPTGHERVALRGVGCSDLAVTYSGAMYIADESQHKVWWVDSHHQKRVVDSQISQPCGVCLTPDQGWLLVADRSGHFVFSFQIQDDGSLVNGENWVHLHLDDLSVTSVSGRMVTETFGRIYIPTPVGIQVSDPLGRIRSILLKPGLGALGGLAFGGKDFDVLYASCGGEIFKRKINATGVSNAQEPIKPPIPQL